MNSQYQTQPGQYPLPQSTQSSQTPNATGPGTTFGNHRFNDPQAPAAAYTSALPTTAATQQYTVPQYPQQPSQYLPLAGPIAMGAANQQSSATGTNHLAPNPYFQNQQSSMVPQLQVSQQPPVPQPHQPQQYLPQYHLMASGMQYSNQTQYMTHHQPPTPQQPQKSPGIDFTQLLEASPAPQQVSGNNFNQLMQAAPPASTSSNVVTTTTTRTETYKGANAGGKARKQAEAQGEEEVQLFEQNVRKLIKRICPCPMNAPWYNGPEGYICGEGIHYLYHKDIDKAFAQPGWLPQVTWVNTFNDPESSGSGTLRIVHPPPVAFHEPMHRVRRVFMKTVRRDGTFRIVEGEGEGLRKSGCNDECLRGLVSLGKTEAHHHLRQNGYNPYATRHAMFD